MRFVDTSVLLYAVSRTPNEEAKARVARELLNERDLCLSVQVLQEFYVQATRQGHPGALNHEQASALVQSFTRFPVQPITTRIVAAALATKVSFGISYWDSAIIEAARALGSGEVLSEDLADGHDYDGVRVVNPFSS